MKNPFKKLMLIGILLSVSGFAFAGDGNGSSRTFELRRHEIAVGGSFIPGHYVYEFDRIGDECSQTYDNAWWISYTYNFTNVFALQVSLTYDGYKYKSEPWETGYSGSGHEYYITPMVTARFSWLNRPIVRLYSSAGVGLITDSYTWTDNTGKKHKFEYGGCGFGWQVTAIGIHIGKKLYGYAEVGLGTNYAFGCAGIGYRF